MIKTRYWEFGVVSGKIVANLTIWYVVTTSLWLKCLIVSLGLAEARGNLNRRFQVQPLLLTITFVSLGREPKALNLSFAGRGQNGDTECVYFGIFELSALVSISDNPLIWRRGRDSNPRWDVIPHTLSRRAT